MKLLKALTCEFLGTAFLLATVVGSGILAHNLDAGNVAVTVMSVAIATGCVLLALIFTFGAVSANFNPAVTLMNVLQRNISIRHALLYMAVQICGAICGVVTANLMFDLPAFAWSQHARTGNGQWLGEFIATFGLLTVIQGTARYRAEAVPSAVAAYVAGAILFTSSTCFANPAVTISRIFTDTITGIRSADVVAFIVSQIVATIAACVLGEWLFKAEDQPSGSSESPLALTDREILDALKKEIARRKLSGSA